MIAALSEKAMLVDLTISLWSGRRLDRDITREVSDNHGAAADAGRYNKLLISKDAIAGPEKAASALRAAHYKFTLPWSDSGTRLLPSAAYFDYTAAIAAGKEDFGKAVDEFVSRWPNLVDEARLRLNSMFSQADYPEAEAISRRYGVSTVFYPLPDASDFRVSLTADEERRIREDLEITVTERIEAAMLDVWRRIFKPVAHMAERLSKYEVDDAGKVTNSFRDSLVTNVRDIVDLLPKLNMGDTHLAELAAEIQFKLCAFEPQELRESAVARQTALSSAQAILKKMEGYI